MEELIDAIYTTFTANSTLSASLSGGLFFEEATQGVSYPYGVYFVNNVEPSGYLPISTTTNKVEEYSIQFNIWDESRKRTTITGIEDDMKECYDDTIMTVVNHTNTFTTLERSHLFRDPEKRWQLTMDYRIRLRRT